MACVDLPAFPLQVALRERASWRAEPVVVVDRDRPNGVVQWVNEPAWATGVRPGVRFAAALSLCHRLRAAVVDDAEMARAVAAMAERLRRFSPHVEPSAEDPGVFWLDASGLGRLFASLARWGRLVDERLRRDGWRAQVVVGFTKFGSLAVSKGAADAGAREAIVFADRDEETAAASGVSIDRLPLTPKTLAVLAKLGVRDVGAFASLPAKEIERRLGAEAAGWHRLARGEAGLFEPAAPDAPVRHGLTLDYAERSSSRLMVVVGRLLRPALGDLAERGMALAGLAVRLVLEERRLGDGRTERTEAIRPAAPTLDERQVLELIRLRLETPDLLRSMKGHGVVEVALTADGAVAKVEQLDLFAETPPRNLAAADRALARVRASLGRDAVVVATLRAGHLPEANFAWEPLDSLERHARAKQREARRVAARQAARAPEARRRRLQDPPEANPLPRITPGDDASLPEGTLIRRILARPVMLPARSRHEPDGWMLRGMDQGAVVKTYGPFVVSGGWWRKAVWREYHFAEMQEGGVLWIYYDRVRRRWFLQGGVE